MYKGTAAHTIYPKDSILPGRNRSAQVFLGHTDTDQMLELGRHPVRRVVVHKRLVPNLERSTSRLYIVTLLI